MPASPRSTSTEPPRLALKAAPPHLGVCTGVSARINAPNGRADHENHALYTLARVGPTNNQIPPQHLDQSLTPSNPGNSHRPSRFQAHHVSYSATTWRAKQIAPVALVER